MAAYALFFVHLRSDPSLFINSFLFYLISIYRVIYHCSPRSARSSRLRIRAHLRRTGRAMAARIAKDLRAYPEVFFCFRWFSALHLLAEKAGDRLRELALGFSGGGAAARGGVCGGGSLHGRCRPFHPWEASPLYYGVFRWKLPLFYRLFAGASITLLSPGGAFGDILFASSGKKYAKNAA